MKNNRAIIVKDTKVTMWTIKKEDYLNLTDIIKGSENDGIVYNWLSKRDTIEFLGLWEKLNNENFNIAEYDVIISESGFNRFLISVENWLKRTSAIGFNIKKKNIYAHRDIALKFCNWLSPGLELYVLKEFQRLKETENKKENIVWDIKRELSRINYKMQTEAIKNNLITNGLSGKEQGYIYSGEADILNEIVFGSTAKKWKQDNPDKDGNIRDYATYEQLIVITNLEILNTEMIESGTSKNKRIEVLKRSANRQMSALLKMDIVKKLSAN